jgi:Xaa-Pro dipeptidase
VAGTGQDARESHAAPATEQRQAGTGNHPNGTRGEPLIDRPSEVRENLRRLRELLASRADGAEAGAFRWRRNFAWLTAGGDSHVDAANTDGVAILLVTADAAVVLTTVIEAARILEEEIAGLDLDVVSLPWHEPEAMIEEVRRRARWRVAWDGDLEPELAWIRAELNPREQARLRALAGETTRAVTDTFAELVPGDTEWWAAGRLAANLARQGIAAPVLLAAADARIGRYRHPIPTRAAIGESLMLVAVGERGGLHAAVTRMGWLQGRPDRERERRYESAVRIHGALAAASRPNVRLATALEAGIQSYAREGFPDEWRLHHQGGVIGYGSREVIATPSVQGTLRAGMALAWNPSISGVKVEETVLISDSGAIEVLTVDPRWPTSEDVADIL